MQFPLKKWKQHLSCRKHQLWNVTVVKYILLDKLAFWLNTLVIPWYYNNFAKPAMFIEFKLNFSSQLWCPELICWTQTVILTDGIDFSLQNGLTNTWLGGMMSPCSGGQNRKGMEIGKENLFTVRCCYNVVHYNMILHISLQWLRHNRNQGLHSQKTSHNSASRASYGVSIVRILKKINRIISAQHCILYDIDSLPALTLITNQRSSVFHTWNIPMC